LSFVAIIPKIKAKPNPAAIVATKEVSWRIKSPYLKPLVADLLPITNYKPKP